MRFIQTDDRSAGTEALRTNLISALENDKTVLWLLSGGSNVAACVDVMASIPIELQAKLTITLCDERYGEVGHADSNFQQLLTAGFQVADARLLPVLQEGLSLEQTTQSFAELLEHELVTADVVIGQLGIGADGHIAGILPGSTATADTEAYAIGYLSDPYQRITMTFTALRHITADYSFVFGAEKRAALERLQVSDLALADQPSQILKQLPEAYVFNDQIGDPQ